MLKLPLVHTGINAHAVVICSCHVIDKTCSCQGHAPGGAPKRNMYYVDDFEPKGIFVYILSNMQMLMQFRARNSF